MPPPSGFKGAFHLYGGFQSHLQRAQEPLPVAAHQAGPHLGVHRQQWGAKDHNPQTTSPGPNGLIFTLTPTKLRCKM